jgi:hypothetical protein
MTYSEKLTPPTGNIITPGHLNKNPVAGILAQNES